MPQYRDEFPDFDYDLPEIAGFTDGSWHNDMCPVLRSKWFGAAAGDIEVWCDYLDTAKREFPSSGKRFTVVKTTGDEERETLCETDDVEEAILAAENALTALQLRDDGLGFGGRA